MTRVLRIAGYFAAFLALLVLLFLLVVMIAMAAYGIAVVRSYVFALFVTSYVLIGLPAALALAVWLGTRRRARD